MEYRNERLDKLEGRPVIVKYLDGPDLTEDELQEAYERPGLTTEAPARSCTAVMQLLGYDSVGATVKTMKEASTNVFLPWGAVLGIYGSTDIDEV